MSKKEKLRARFASLPRDFTWKECCQLLDSLGFVRLEGSGSRVKFHHPRTDAMISLHRPHPGNEMKQYQMKLVRDQLKQDGML